MKNIIILLMIVCIAALLVACTVEKAENNIEEHVQDVQTFITYANWSDEFNGMGEGEKCLNADKFIFSDAPRLPIFKFDTKSELNEFKDRYKNILTMDIGYDEVPSFNEMTNQYDDSFFANHSILLAYVSSGSGSIRYGVKSVTIVNGVCIMIVEQLNNPEVYTDDMSGWFAIAVVSKDFIKDCKEFDAQFYLEPSINDYLEEETTKKSYGIIKVSMDEIEKIMNDNENYVIIDVRTIAEYNEGHIPNAICIPNEDIGEDVSTQLPDKEQLLLVYCRSGRRSEEATDKLEALGYTNIVDFGGITDWKGEIEK